MNWSAWFKIMAPLTIAAGLIWFLALLSHQSGNTTAVNALVGIPMGLALGAAMAAAITWATDY
jgi:hypothetical protein